MLPGRAVVRPGAVSRADSLRQAGREAAGTCAGVAVMLLLVITCLLSTFCLLATGKVTLPFL